MLIIGLVPQKRAGSGSEAAFAPEDSLDYAVIGLYSSRSAPVPSLPSCASASSTRHPLSYLFH